MFVPALLALLLDVTGMVPSTNATTAPSANGSVTVRFDVMRPHESFKKAYPAFGTPEGIIPVARMAERPEARIVGMTVYEVNDQEALTIRVVAKDPRRMVHFLDALWAANAIPSYVERTRECGNVGYDVYFVDQHLQKKPTATTLQAMIEEKAASPCDGLAE